MEAARLFEVSVLQTGSLSNPTLTWGLIYPLRFHKTELEDLCALFKKQKTFQISLFWIQIKETWFFPFRTMAHRNVRANVRIGRGHFPLFDESIGGL